VSLAIAIEVARIAYDRGFARRPRPDDLAATVAAEMYQPIYESLVDRRRSPR
jgi:malate dehydrogenase (oxaloacetate-decarboxylating)(NADP+)